MDKVKTKKQKTQEVPQMSVVNPYAAGIDVGDTEHVVAVPERLDTQPVRSFGTMTCDLKALVAWLIVCEIKTVAMESTGVYWKPLFRLLLQAGIEVYLVNAAHVKNVSGRKTDESDARWLQKLHSFGLLSSSYLPDDEQETLRSLVRYRRSLIEDSSRFINRMQKSLELMNIKFHTVIRDITGKTGKAVLEAIIRGERKAENFLPLIDKHIKADEQTILKSLEGSWQAEHIFTLEQSYIMYQYFQQSIERCDQQIEKQLQSYEASRNEGIIEESPLEESGGKDSVAAPHNEQQDSVVCSTRKKKQKNHPGFDVRGYLKRIHGVDVVNIYGLSESSGLEILAETGTDLSKWPSDKHFRSWLNLCPNNKISGGKLISSRLLSKKPNAASKAFRSAAKGVQKSNNWLGDYFRRERAKGGYQYAIVATAAKIATIYYKMVRYKEEFKPVDLEQYQQKYKKAKIAYLERALSKLKYEVA